MTIDSRDGLRLATGEFDEPVTPGRTPSRRARWIAVAVAAAVVVLVGAAVVANRDDENATVRLRTAPADNEADTWSALPDATSQARVRQLLVATDNGVLVWGGSEATGDGFPLADGAYLEAGAQVWRRLPDAPLASDGGDAVGVWTGTEVVVVNGREGAAAAAAFNPSTFTWRSLPDPPLDLVDTLQTRILDIDGAIVVFQGGGTIDRNHVVLLDEASGTWRMGTPPPVRFSVPRAVPAGDRAVVAVFGDRATSRCGVLHLLTYQPTSDTWDELPAGPVAESVNPVIAWTGSELFVGGGRQCTDTSRGGRSSSSTANLLDLTTGTWRAASGAPVGISSSLAYDALWTGRSVVTLEEHGAPLLYNPNSDTWHLGPATLTGNDVLDVEATPFVGLDGAVVVSGGAVATCPTCYAALAGTYRYQLPVGY